MKVPKRVKYETGDIIEIVLNINGVKGYGRILKIDNRNKTILIEFYKIKPVKETINIFDLKGLDVILSIWCIDEGIRDGTWKIIGNIPVNAGFRMPDFWSKDVFNPSKILLYRGDEILEITEDQIGTAQPYGIFGDEAARIRYEYELKIRGIA
jgi:hypothetical protein